MKLIVLSERTVIDGVIRERGELVSVPDGWMENVKRVVGAVDVKQAEAERKTEIEKIKLEKQKKEKDKPKEEPPVEVKPKNGKTK